MGNKLKRIDISAVPELLRIAEEVRESNEPRILGRDGEDLALLSPVTRALEHRLRRRKTQADYEAFLPAAGSWKDVDTEAFKAYVYERRRASSRPPVKL